VTRPSKDAKTRTLRTGEWLCAGIGATCPVPSGVRSNNFVRRLRPMNHSDLATFRVDCHAIGETDYGQYGRKEL
jgi:hypothetical protein